MSREELLAQSITLTTPSPLQYGEQVVIVSEPVRSNGRWAASASSPSSSVDVVMDTHQVLGQRLIVIGPSQSVVGGFSQRAILADKLDHAADLVEERVVALLARDGRR